MAESYLRLRDFALEAIHEGLQQPFTHYIPSGMDTELGFAYNFC
jgi:hypothetical protein